MSHFARGVSWRGEDPRERAAALQAAFDYRGDVTLKLVSGETLTGYVANRDDRPPEPYLEMFPAAGGERRRIGYREIEDMSLFPEELD